jgi:tRNA_anti-like
MKKILLFLVFLGLVGGGTAYYLWNKPHENMTAASAAMTVSAADLYAAFNADEMAATTKYGADQTIAVQGVVKETSKGDDGTIKVLLDTGSDFGVLCELDPLSKHARTEFNPGENVTLKGKCAGINLDVQMVRCVEGK